MKSVFIILSLLVSLVCLGQSTSQIRDLAEKYYNSGKYKEAVDFFERVHETSPTDDKAHLKLALSYYHSLQYQKAMVQFKALLEKGFKEEKALYYYGLLLKTEGHYKQADSTFALLIENTNASEEYRTLASFQQKGCKLGIRMLRVKNTHKLRPLLVVNSSSHEFGLTQHKNGYIALSTTRNTGQKQYYDGQFGGLLPNILGYVPSEESGYKQNKMFESFNSNWAEGTGCFTNDGKSFYFSSCKNDEGCKLYVSNMTESGEWSAATVLDKNINKPGFDAKQPNASITGDTLFFVSNRPGGLGGTDIWMSFKLRDGRWAPAINMGATINTAADEMSPFYSSSFNSLLFSSNGHAGYGGFDTYLAKGHSFYAPDIYNIGLPFNSSYDDNYFSLGKKGFITTNRNKTDFDIYEFDYDNEIDLLKSFMTDESLIDLILQASTSLELYSFRLEEYEGYHMLQPVVDELPDELPVGDPFQKIIGNGTPQSVIRLSLNDTLEMLTMVSDKESFEIRMLPDTLDNHMVTENKVATNYEWEPMNFNGYEYEFEKIYFDFDSEELREESKETLNDLVKIFQAENIVMVDIHTHTDHFGEHDYNYILSENRGLNILKYLNQQGLDYGQIRIFPNGEKQLLSDHDSWYSRLFNRRAEIVVYTKEPVKFSKPDVFIVRKDVGISDVSEFLKIPNEKLHEWNGLPSSVTVLKEGHVVRVFDPKHFLPNLNYLIPEEAAGMEFITYTIKNGDTIYELSKKFGVIEEMIVEENHLNYYDLNPGDEIIIYKPNKMLMF